MLHFHTVICIMLSYSQAKGIFIPLYHDSGELQEAIANGAIGDIMGVMIKHYQIICPISFLCFYANDLWKGLKNMLESIS